MEIEQKQRKHKKDEEFKDSLRNVLNSEVIDIDFGMNNALLGLGSSMKNSEDVMACLSLIKEVFVEKDIAPEKTKTYLGSFIMGLTLSGLTI